MDCLLVITNVVGSVTSLGMMDQEVSFLVPCVSEIL
jgi:hypothetical protein